MVANPIDHGGFGMMESADGVHYQPIKAPDILTDIQIPTLEPGGIKKFGDKYYFIGGDANHYGFSGYSVYTYVADSPMGPFRPDIAAYRLTGTSGIDGDSFVHVLAAFVKDSPEPLVSDPFSFSVDAWNRWTGCVVPSHAQSDCGQGRASPSCLLEQNDLAKGDEIKIDPESIHRCISPGQTDSNPIIRVAAAGDSIAVHTDKNLAAVPLAQLREEPQGRCGIELSTLIWTRA